MQIAQRHRHIVNGSLILLCLCAIIQMMMTAAKAQPPLTELSTRFTCDTLLTIHGALDAPTVTGPNSLACGTRALATTGSAAVGDQARATGTNSVAVGFGAVADAPNSVAIGTGSTANVPNTVSVGASGNERRITNVAAGINQTDAVNVGQLQSTSTSFQSRFDAMSNVIQSRFDVIQSRFDAMTNVIQSRFDTMSNAIENVTLESRRGIVAVVALTSTPMPSAPGKTAWAFNSGFYKGEVGIGISLAHRLNTAVPLAITGGYSNGGGTQHVGRVGMAGEF